mgnify:CR=1 FL=1
MLPTLLVIEDDIAMQRFLALYFADTYEVVVQETGDVVPVVMRSGSEQSADRVRCLRLGADDFVVKPFNPEELRARLDNLLRRIRRTQRSLAGSAA